MLSIVNVVGAGDLGVELDLAAVKADIDAVEVKYDEENYPGLYAWFVPDGAVVTLYGTGSYHISGAESKEEVFEMHKTLC